MVVNVIIPVYNRLHHTIRVIGSLRAQTLVKNLRIIVVDDGSTDGTADYLNEQDDVFTIKGDGNLWWAGSIDLGICHVMVEAAHDDYVIFLNNDTWFAPDYIATLIEVSRQTGGVPVGSVIHEENRENSLVSIGPVININRIAVWDLLSQLTVEEIRQPKPVYRVHALSGRGALYPVSFFIKHGGMRPRLLPHYLADYELSMRFAREAKVALVVSTRAIVYSPPVYGNYVSQFGLLERLFSTRSSSNIFRKLIFYCLVGSPSQRITAPLRLACFGLYRYFIKLINK